MHYTINFDCIPTKKVVNLSQSPYKSSDYQSIDIKNTPATSLIYKCQIMENIINSQAISTEYTIHQYKQHHHRLFKPHHIRQLNKIIVRPNIKFLWIANKR